VRRIDTVLVFVGKNGKPAHIDKAFRDAVAQAGIENFHFHDCRHTTASLLAQAGVSSLLIKEVPGHRTLQMVVRYSRLAPNCTRGVLEQLAEKIK
jgi:integrase